ncbi:hypothetical protein MTO96_050450 [Rhipicephalus appendiculatus]
MDAVVWCCHVGARGLRVGTQVDLRYLDVDGDFKIELSPNMKNFSALSLLVVLTVFLIISSRIEATGHQPHRRVRRGTGCPDIGPCFTSCRNEGHFGGYCMLFTCVCV